MEAIIMAMADPQDFKTERLEARITPRQKSLFQRAADLRGQSLTDFALANLQEVAERIIRECEMIELTARDSRLLIDALLNPSAPNERLFRAAGRYKRRLEA
jgi:uncharacterized protein (DUF1778 family)